MITRSLEEHHLHRTHEKSPDRYAGGEYLERDLLKQQTFKATFNASITKMNKNGEIGCLDLVLWIERIYVLGNR